MSSSIDAASLAGTWISSSLAIIALIGIIGPFYALRTAYGKKTRALNGVWDGNGTYLTKGWSIGNSPALFRRSRVPNLARNYQSNYSGVASILPAGENPASYQYLQSQVESTSWNTGWSKLCALIHSHHKSPRYEDAGMCAGSTDGKLEIIDTFSALVVSRYWIFFLGLLGVYGHKQEDEWPQLALRPDTGADHSGDVLSLMSNRSFGFDRQHPDYNNPARYYRGFYSRHGVQIFSSSPGREIEGYTGNFKSLGRQKHSAGIRSLVAFQYVIQPRVSPTVSPIGTLQHMPLTPNLPSRFWFAFGYLPRRTGPPISYLDPIDPRLTASNAFPGAGEGLTLDFSLEMSSALPILLTHCSDALKIGHGAGVLRWESSSMSRQIAPEWHTVNQGSQSPAILLWKPDIVKILDAFLHTDCDERGFLALKFPCTIWNKILQLGPSTIPSFSFEPVSEFLEIFRKSQKHHNEQSDSPVPKVEIEAKTVPAWNFENHQYFASKIKEMAQFENYLFKLIEDCGMDMINYPIAIAFIIDEVFREDLTNTLTRNDEESINQDISSKNVASNSIRGDEGSISQDIPSQHESESNHSTSRKQSPSASFENNGSEDRYPTDDETPWQENRHYEQSLKESPISEFSMNYHPAGSQNLPDEYGDSTNTLRLSWKRKGDEEERSIEIPGYDCTRLKSRGSPTGHIISMEGEDVNCIVLVAIWTVTRCALWRSYRDSWALIDFVNDLDRNVFVL